MAKLSDYSQQTDDIYRDKTSELRAKLPKFLDKYFIAKADLLPSTLYNYAMDLTVFFEWAKSHLSEFCDVPMHNLPFEILESLDSDDIAYYIKEYLTRYEHDGHIYRNDLNGKARKLASLRSVYKYYLTGEKIEKDPTALISLKTRSDFEIVYLQPNEVADLLDHIEYGDNPTADSSSATTNSEKINDRRAAFHRINRCRDLAIITTLLGTGMRISELVGLNIADIDFDDAAIHITRKGHKRDTVYMGEEIITALSDYLENSRSRYEPEPDDDALFLSLRHKRINVRSVEILLKKYVAAALPYRSGEKITPHKMRSTFGTTLYKETGDIKLVADALGHRNIATTQKHYAATDTAIKRSAFSNVKLR